MEGMQLLLVPDGFRAELSPNAPAEAVEAARLWREDMPKALYDFGMKPEQAEDAIEIFACRLVDVFLKKLMDLPELEMIREKAKVTLTEEDTDRLLMALPFALGTEVVNRAWIHKIIKGLNAVYKREMGHYEGSVSLYMEEKRQDLHVPQRVFFHLVESKEEAYPFAFLATYAGRDEGGKVCHYPLKYAMKEYGNDRSQLLELLKCLNKAAEASPFVAELMEKGELFHPLRLTDSEAYVFLRSVPLIEEAGILCRIPNWWRSTAYVPRVSVTMGRDTTKAIGAQALLTMVPHLTVDGVELTREEITELLAKTEGLAQIKGKWVEVNHEKLKKLLDQMDSTSGSLSILQAMRMQAGISEKDGDSLPVVENGAWLSEVLHKMRNPKENKEAKTSKAFKAKLRPYQKTGFQWLSTMAELGFGACLADDMGLGKTVQVLAFLDWLRVREPDASCLLVVPASLLGNWQKEAEKFAPDMSLEIFHGRTAEEITSDLLERKRERKQMPFLSITTYGMAARAEGFSKLHFRCLILDESQAIKNAGTKQTKTIKKIKADIRIAMTGTPVENDLSNLWSLYDFLNPGLLGSMAEFKHFTARLKEHPEAYEKLRSMVSPFLLRRMKSDKSIIKDLPEKIETMEYVELSAKQIVLYRKVVAELEDKLETLDGIERRGVVLAAISKLKQICNHPDQYLGLDAFEEADSGKLQLLRELCSTMREKRERVLVFTQFREIIPALQRFLTEIFGRPGYAIHGGTPAAERTKIVDAFQGEDYVPFLVISLKAGGTGLNLTKATHVIHFDRWWNPAVENQATDRAYRIGQKSNVIVHKLMCRNTVEEKIDEIITGKKELAERVITSGSENWLTEMSNEQLMNLLKLK